MDISMSVSTRSVPSALEAERHRRDMELHRLNAEPRMVVEAEAWVNLNEGGGADMICSTQVCFWVLMEMHIATQTGPVKLFKLGPVFSAGPSVYV